MDYKDYYKILGVKKSSTQDEIKKAFRKLAVKFHPDKNAGDKKAEEKFKEINEANEVLGDIEKKKKYDELGENYNQYRQHGGQEGNFDWNKWSNRGSGRQTTYTEEDAFGEGGNFSDFFENIFGSRYNDSGRSRQQQTGPRKGMDQTAELQINLKDAYSGGDKQILLNGQKINLKLKPGSYNGQLLRMKGKGQPGTNGGPNGDLIIELHIVNQTHYKLSGHDLHFEENLDLSTAVLGGKLNVNVFEKIVTITVPEGTNSGKIFRLKGMGMPIHNSLNESGDAYVKVMIQVPKNLTPEEKAFFKKLSPHTDFNTT